MNRPLLAVAAAALVLTLAGCGAHPVSGTVVAQKHTDAHRTLKQTSACGHDLRGKYTCGKSRQKWVTEPARWSLVVKTATGTQETVSVTESEYTTHPVGSTYTR